MNGKENYNGIMAFMMRMPRRRARPGTQIFMFFLMIHLLYQRAHRFVTGLSEG